MERQYLCIDFKSFYASVECVERSLDPMSAKLVVADPERCDTTICLAVSPALKALGVKNRCRVYEIPPHLEYVKAPPRMKLYIQYSAEIYGIYLKYISKDDIYVYSIDEAFLDVTDYLMMYNMSAKQIGEMIRRDILKTTGIPSAFGVGTNLYLAKIALDITAKHSSEFVGELDEEKYKKELWDHRPLTDFWRIGAGTAKRLEERGIFTMRDVTRAAPAVLEKLLGVDWEILYDHAWGREETTISDIKAYKAQSHSLSSGQVLSRDYSLTEGLTIIKEMADNLSLELFDEGLVTRSITISVTYSGVEKASARGTQRLEDFTNTASVLISASAQLFERVMDKNRTIRKVNLVFNDVVDEGFSQLSLFTNEPESGKERRQMQAVSEIKKRFGKNSIIRGLDLKKEATSIERNRQIGGHKSGGENSIDKF